MNANQQKIEENKDEEFSIVISEESRRHYKQHIALAMDSQQRKIAVRRMLMGSLMQSHRGFKIDEDGRDEEVEDVQLDSIF